METKSDSHGLLSLILSEETYRHRVWREALFVCHIAVGGKVYAACINAAAHQKVADGCGSLERQGVGRLFVGPIGVQ